VLVKIDNPETIAKHEQALAAKIVADAQLANINAGTRAEVIAAKKAALERAQASVVLAQKTYDRVSQLAEHGNAPIARLDQATDTLHESQRAVDQATVCLRRADRGLQPSGDPRARRGHRRRGPVRYFARVRGTGGGISRAEHRRTRWRSRIGGAGD